MKKTSPSHEDALYILLNKDQLYSNYTEVFNTVFFSPQINLNKFTMT